MFQCTFWCSVLSDRTPNLPRCLPLRFNAPSGAQCFPTPQQIKHARASCNVSMHLLVLSASRLCTERLKTGFSSLNAPSGAQCFPTLTAAEVVAEFPSQCTFWCSVLSDTFVGLLFGIADWVSMHLLVLSAFRPTIEPGPIKLKPYCLNAPSGAQCFPTMDVNVLMYVFRKIVSMHLLVLSASRRAGEEHPVRTVRVSMHLLVLSASRQSPPRGSARPRPSSQCTFWCSVLPDGVLFHNRDRLFPVSMHLLVLSASRLKSLSLPSLPTVCLNAPSGAQCFPTAIHVAAFFGSVVSMHLLVLSASRHGANLDEYTLMTVSMHLLVLSAFRRAGDRVVAVRPSGCLNAPSGAQCFPTRTAASKHQPRWSQCTFWCSVLPDKNRGVQASTEVVSMHLLVLSAFRQEQHTPFGRF